MKKAKLPANVTILFVLILTPLFTLLSALNESARISVQRTLVKSALYVSTLSLFSEYAREIYDEYGIFIISETSGTLKDRYQSYLEYNINPKKNLLKSSDISGMYTPLSFNLNITDTTYITDDNGRVFANQAVSYAKSHIAGTAVENIKKIFSETSGVLGDGVYIPPIGTDIDINTAKEITEKIENSSCGDLFDADITFGNSPYDEVTSSEAVSLKNSIEDFLRQIMTQTLLTVMLPDPSKVSSLKTDISTVPSNIAEYDFPEYTSDSSFSLGDIADDGIDKFLYVSYLLEKFPNYLDYVNSPCGLPLEYQLEYIISGTSNDKTNLLQTGMDLISLRTCFNMISILLQSDKCAQAEELAITIVGGISVPFLTAALQYIILSLWASAESIVDVRDLFDNKKVPLIKNASQWTLSLENITEPSSYEHSNNPGNAGLCYTDYLSTLLFYKDNTEIYYRAMDLIQINTAHKHLPGFTMTTCVSGISAELSCACRPIFLLPGRGFYFLHETADFSY